MYYIIAQTPRYKDGKYQASKNLIAEYETLQLAADKVNNLWKELQQGLIRVDIFHRSTGKKEFSLVNMELIGLCRL